MNKNWYITLELPIYPPTQDENVIRQQIDKIREQCAINNDSDFTKQFWQALPKIRKDMLGVKNKREKFIKEINNEIIPKIEESAKRLFSQDSANNSSFNKESDSLNIPVSYIKNCYNSVLQANNEIKKSNGNINNIEISQKYNISIDLVEYLIGLNNSNISQTTDIPIFNGTTQEAINIILKSLKDIPNVTQNDFVSINLQYGIPLDFIEEVYKQFFEEQSENAVEFKGTAQEAINIILKSLGSISNVSQDDFISINSQYGIPLDFIEEVYKQYFNINENTSKMQPINIEDIIKQKLENISLTRSVNRKDIIAISKDLNISTDIVLDVYNELYPDDPIIMNISNRLIPKPIIEPTKKESIKNISNTSINKRRIIPSKPSPLVELITHEILNRGTENITKDIIKEISEDLNAPISMVTEVYKNISDLSTFEDSTMVQQEESSNTLKNVIPVSMNEPIQKTQTKKVPIPVQVPVPASLPFVAPIISVSVITDSTNKSNTISWVSKFDENQSNDLNSECTYSVIRKIGDIPQKYTDGDCIADNLTENYFQDTSIDNALEYGYSIVPIYKGTIYNENIGKCNNKVRNIFDISPENISIISEDKVVKISWNNIPSDASIKIQKDNQILNINSNSNSFKDTAVWNGQTYLYRIYLMYNILGRQYITNSLEYKVTPMPNINPIKNYNAYISDDDMIMLNYKYQNPINDSNLILYSYNEENSIDSVLNNIYKYSIDDVPKELSIVTKQNLKDSDTIKISNEFKNSIIILGVAVNNCIVLSGIIDISTLEKNSRYTISSFNLDGNGNLSISYECDSNNNIKLLNRIIIMKSNSNFKSLANINDSDNIIIKDNFETRGITTIQGIKNNKYYISMVCEYKQFDNIWYSKIDEHTFNNMERIVVYYSFNKPSIFNGNKLEIIFEQPENKEFSLKNISIHANKNAIPMIINDTNEYIENLPDIYSSNGKYSTKINGSKNKRLYGVIVSNNSSENESFILRLKPNHSNIIS